MRVTHEFVSTNTDTQDATFVRKNEWNADHVIDGTVDIGAGPHFKKTVVSGQGNYTTSSTTKTPIDSTNLAYLTLDLRVGQVVRCMLTGQVYATGAVGGMDFEVDQPTSGNVYIGAANDRGVMSFAGNGVRLPLNVVGLFVATEDGEHGFRPVWVMESGGTSLTLVNGTSGNDDSPIQLSVEKIGVAEVGIAAQYLGKTTVGASWGNPSGAVRAGYLKRVIAPGDGIISSIGVYAKGNGSNVSSLQAFILSDNAGVPNQVLAIDDISSLQMYIDTNGRWIDHPISFLVTGGTAYWVGVNTYRDNTGGFQIAYDASIGTDYSQGNIGYVADNALNAYESGTDDYSIRALFIYASADSPSLPTTRASRTSGNITANSTSWANVDTGLDLTIPAQEGDVLLVEGSFYMGSEAVSLGLDAVTIVSGSPVNSVSGANGASGFGVSGWASRTGTIDNTGCGIQYVVQAGDISAGTVTLRLRYRTHIASNKTLYANADEPLHWSVVNLG